MVSVKDVAQKANVSPTTVSAVVNNRNCVKPSTRERVLEAIAELNYIPNVSARELVTKRKQSIGFISMVYDTIPSRNTFNVGMFYNEYLQGVSDVSEITEYGLLLENFYYNPVCTDIPKVIEKKRVDAVFVVGSLYSDDFIKRLKKHINAIVAVNCFTEYADSVRSDYVGSCYMAIQYLLENGHRRIAFVNGDSLSYSFPYKLIGYQKALKDYQIEFDAQLVFDSKYIVENGYLVAKQIVERFKGNLPDAIFFASDIIAAGAYKYFSEIGIAVPEDISVIGYENLVISDFLNPPLTSVDLHKEEIGKIACSLMIDRLKNPHTDLGCRVVPSSIVIRNSVRTIQ